MNKSKLLILSLFAGSLLHAGPVLLFNLDTSSLFGTTGSLDFQFNPGPNTTQSETAEVFNFTGATYLSASQVDSGAASGGPVGTAPISILNSTAFGSNDDFEAITFGNLLSFEVAFSGPGVDSPDGTSLSPSEFVFTLYSDTAGTIPSSLTTDPGGVIGTATVRGSDGTVSFDAVSANLGVSSVPEPASIWLTFGALAALGGMRLFGRSTAR